MAYMREKSVNCRNPRLYLEVLRKLEQKDIELDSPHIYANRCPPVLFVLEISQVSKYKTEAQRFNFSHNVADGVWCT